jgi:UDP-N-acetylmuramate dehydrogenase
VADPVAERATLRLEDPQVALDGLCAALQGAPGVSLRRREPMAAHLPLRCGGPVDLWVEVADLPALRAALEATRQAGLPWRACWPFEELLVRDGGLRGVAIRPGRAFEGAALLPEDAHGPARLRLGAAEPWSAARAALASAPGGAALHGPLSQVAAWPGCPGALLHGSDLQPLEGLLHAVSWVKGNRVERTVLAEGAAPSSLPASAILLSVELPLSPIAGARRPKHRPVPPPPGTLFADDGPLRTAPQLVAAGLSGTRLRAWRLATTEAGVLVNLGGGDCATATLLAKGLAEHVHRARGMDPTLRIPVIGLEATRKQGAPPPRRR